MSVPRGKPTFGHLLRKHRLAAGLTQEALAERSGVSGRGVQLLEADSVRPRRSTIAELVRALSLTAADREELERAAVPASRAPSGGARHRRDMLSVARSRPEGDAPAHGLVALSRPSLTNIPWPVSSLLGREADLAALHELIAVDRQRMVTLTGVGGSGKTRLGVQVAADLLDTFADGVWFVELAPTSSPEMVPRVIAGPLGVSDMGGAPILDSLLGFLRRKSLLLLLDNCEHLIDACAALAERLLTACPDLHILATSREPLQIHGERRWQVQPLAIPDLHDASSLDALAGSASVQLFLERAQAIHAGFLLTDANVASVAQVCARLDGIPLAIELAASRVRVLGVDQIAERLANDFRVLASGARGGPTRQQTMQAALDWSYDLLTSSERAAFTAFSTFAGGFELEAAEAVCPPDQIDESDESDILDVLGRLVDKSLVITEQLPNGSRYRLLEPVRQYARRSLLAAGGDGPAHARHATYFGALAERAAPLLRGPEQLTWLERLERDRDNLRAALDWLVQHGEIDDTLRLMVALTPYWEGRGYFSEGRRWLDLARAAADAGDASPSLRMYADMSAGALAQWQGDHEGAERLLTEALTVARALADRRAEAEAVSWLSAAVWRGGALERGIQLGEESFRLGHEIGHTWVMAFALMNVGGALRFTSDTARSVEVMGESVRRFREVGDLRLVGSTSVMLGLSLLQNGEPDRAERTLRDALRVMKAAGERRFNMYALRGLARVAQTRGDRRRTLQLLRASEALREELGVYNELQLPIDPGHPFRAALTGQLNEAEFEEIHATGLGMSPDEVIDEIIASQ